jgi:DNA-binding transcriptional LysR family regulator
LSSLLAVTHFLRTVRAGSFAAAARELNLSAVAVGKNVSALERDLGVRLLNRTTRALSLTEEGRLFFERCDKPLQSIEQALIGAKQASDSPSGLLRVSCLSPIARGFVIPLLRNSTMRWLTWSPTASTSESASATFKTPQSLLDA